MCDHRPLPNPSTGVFGRAGCLHSRGPPPGRTSIDVQKASQMTTPYLFDTGHDPNSRGELSDGATGGAGSLATPTSLSIELTEEVLLLNGRVECRQAAEYLARQPRARWLQHFTRALEIGAFCLERATSSQAWSSSDDRPIAS